MEDVHSAWRAMSCCSGLQPIALLRSLSSWRPPLGAEPWTPSTQPRFAAERKPASGRRAHRTLGARSAGLTGGAVCSAQHTLRGGCGSEARQERRGCTAVCLRDLAYTCVRSDTEPGPSCWAILAHPLFSSSPSFPPQTTQQVARYGLSNVAGLAASHMGLAAGRLLSPRLLQALLSSTARLHRDTRREGLALVCEVSAWGEIPRSRMSMGSVVMGAR